MKIKDKRIMKKLISFCLIAALCVSISLIMSSCAHLPGIDRVDRIEFSASDWGNYAAISAYDKSGNILWNYETPEYEPTELPRVSEIGRKDKNYYFIQDGTVVALNAKTGKKVWENSDFDGSGTGIALGEDAIYLCGYYGPDFYAISYDGKTLTRIDHFDKNYFWASKIEILGEQAAVYLYGGTGDDTQPKVFYVDLNNYQYSTKR